MTKLTLNLSLHLQHFLNFAKAKQSCQSAPRRIRSIVHFMFKKMKTLCGGNEAWTKICAKNGSLGKECVWECCWVLRICSSSIIIIYHILKYVRCTLCMSRFVAASESRNAKNIDVVWWALHLDRIERSLLVPVILYHPVVTHNTWNHIALLILYFNTV